MTDQEPPVTPQYLLEGHAYSLEQGGLLLRDAYALHRRGAFASAVGLAAFGRELVGESVLLFDAWKEVALGGANLTSEEIRKLCVSHRDKQKAGILSSATPLVAE